MRRFSREARKGPRHLFYLRPLSQSSHHHASGASASAREQALREARALAPSGKIQRPDRDISADARTVVWLHPFGSVIGALIGEKVTAARNPFPASIIAMERRRDPHVRLQG
jgi:hypothetical protein